MVVFLLKILCSFVFESLIEKAEEFSADISGSIFTTGRVKANDVLLTLLFVSFRGLVDVLQLT